MWKFISQTSKYSVNENGDIKNNKTSKLLKQDTYNRYARVKLQVDGSEKTFTVHRLVAEAFIPNPTMKPFVNHIDGDTLNNNVSNLEWCTQQENIHHSRNITKNGAVVSTKKILELYAENPTLSTTDFILLLIREAK